MTQYKRFESISKGDLKKYIWYKCRFETDRWIIVEDGKVYLEDNEIYILHNNSYANWFKPNFLEWYKYSWIISYKDKQYNRIEIEVPKTKVLPREVYVSSVSVNIAWQDKDKRILLHDLWENAINRYICVNQYDEIEYRNWDKYDWNHRDYIAEIEEEPTKKKLTVSEIEDKLWYWVEVISEE